MEIPSSPPLASANAAKLPKLDMLLEQLAPLNNRLNLPVGSTITLPIIAQMPVLAEEKQQLLQLLIANPTSPDKTQALKQLLTSPLLTLVTTKLPTPSTPTSLTLLSANPLPPNASLRVTVRPDNQLQLLEALLPQTPKVTSSARIAPSITTPIQPDNAQKPKLEAELSQLLRNVLPKAQPIAPMIQTLNQLATQLPDKRLTPLLPQAVEKLFTGLQQQGENLEKLIKQPDNTALLKQIIKSSGVLLESQLGAELPKATAREKTMSIQPPPLLLQDLKALLLTAIQSLNTAAPNDVDNESDNHNLNNLLRSLFTGQPTVDNNSDEPKKLPNAKFLLQEALLPLLHKSLARIQLQQAQTASALLQEPALSHLQLDIPLKLPEGYGNLAMQIQELPYHHLDEEKSESQKTNKQQVRQWKVFMEFDLGDFGVLAAQIHWLPQQLRAQFWANNQSLRKKTQHQLATLEAQLKAAGLPVDSLICSNDVPPKKTINIQYSLVDIST